MRYALGLLLGCVGLLGGCGHAPEPPGALRVAVTVLPHAWLVRQIGGQHVEVLALVRPGENAELYQPTDEAISQAAQAALFFQTGMPLESSRGFEALRRVGTLRVVDLRQGIGLRRLEGSHVAHDHVGDEGPEDPRPSGTSGEDPKQPPQGKEGPSPVHQASGAPGHEIAQTPAGLADADPHIWLSLRRLKSQAQTVARELAAVDPAHAGDYQRNLAALETRLDEADAAIAKLLAPYRGRAFMVFHPAWGYFAEDYGLRQLAIESEGKEPSDRELTELQELARREQIRVVFVHPQGGQRSAQAVANAIGARIEVIDDLPAELLESLRDTARRIAESFQ